MPPGSSHRDDEEEHHMPRVEAMIAYTMVLMTGYCQSVQAAQHPVRRLHLGAKIDAGLAELARDGRLSDGFRAALHSLQHRWQLMGECSDCGPGDPALPRAASLPAPDLLQ